MGKNERMLVHVAELYYQENLSQSEISEKLMISRASVSRLLEEARQKNIVEIKVHSPYEKNVSLGEEIKEKYKLRHAIVTPSASTFENTMKLCAKAAAEFLLTVMENNIVVGFSWGRASREMVEQMEEDKNYTNISIAQMVGCPGDNNNGLGGLDITRQCAMKFGCSYSNIYCPVEVSSKKLRDDLADEVMVRKALELANRANIVFTGIGNVHDDKNTLFRTGLYSIEDRNEIIEKGGKATIFANWIDGNGNPIEVENHYPISASIETMKKADWAVGMAVSSDYAEAVRAVMSGRYVNMLIVDESLAEELLV